MTIISAWRISIVSMIVLLLASSMVLPSMGFFYPLYQYTKPHSHAPSARFPTCRVMYINSDDPFEILGLNEATTDQKIIKRAYKRMALKYHPDVLSSSQSSPAEKKEASDRFAKINWAYSQLSGKGEDNKTYNTKSTTQKTKGTGGWTPPHRRSGGSQEGSRSYSPGSDSKQNVDWSDFMPKSENSYDTNGDSFGKIFSDLFSGAATSAVSGAAGSTLFKDFIEFLEGNVDGFGVTGERDDPELRRLLDMGTKQEIRNEIDDTELVVDQLTRKLRDIDNEIFTTTAELSKTEKYLEKVRLEETMDELSARKNVVKGYLQKAEQRLLRLQVRFKELKTSNSQWDEIRQESSSSNYSSRKVDSDVSEDSPSSRRSRDGSWKNEGFAPPGTTEMDDNKERSWKAEGFGTSSRRSSRRRQSADSTSKNPAEPTNFRNSGKTQRDVGSEQTWRTEGFGSSRRSRRRDQDTKSQDSSASRAVPDRNRGSSENNSSARISVPASNSSTEPVPPHRRQTSSQNINDDSKTRLREIIVDEEFEKLKRELGL